MFFRTATAIVLALFLAVQVLSLPLPMPLRLMLAARQPNPLTTPIHVERAAAELPLQKRQIPAEIAVKAPDGIIVPYKRSVTDEAPPSRREMPRLLMTSYKRGIPVEIPVYWGTGEHYHQPFPFGFGVKQTSRRRRWKLNGWMDQVVFV